MEHHFSQGNHNHGQGKYNEAIEDWNEAIYLNPNSAAAYSNRGDSKAGLKQYDQAVEDYDKAISLDLNFADAYFNKACAYSMLDKPAKETLEFLAKAINMDGKYIEMARDDDFKSLRKSAAFRKLVGLGDAA